MTGLMAAVICVVSLLQISLPTGVPLTLQVFAVALSGYVLGWARGSLSVLIYIAVGLVGAPVFAGFMGGPSVFFGPTGGFLAGFLVLSLLSGTGKDKGAAAAVALGILGLVFCHALGILHYMNVMKSEALTAFLTVSLPYIFKDTALLVGAYFVSLPIKKRIKKETSR